MTRFFLAPAFALAVAGCGGPSSNLSAIGGACKATTDCQVGLSCETGDPGGQCVKPCTSDGDCGAGAVCNGEMKCYKACTGNADCRQPDYGCTTDSTAKKFCDAVATPGDM
jgi:hypothetical protein